jgi:hypothetical protein
MISNNDIGVQPSTKLEPNLFFYISTSDTKSRNCGQSPHTFESRPRIQLLGHALRVVDEDTHAASPQEQKVAAHAPIFLDKSSNTNLLIIVNFFITNHWFLATSPMMGFASESRLESSYVRSSFFK